MGDEVFFSDPWNNCAARVVLPRVVLRLTAAGASTVSDMIRSLWARPVQSSTERRTQRALLGQFRCFGFGIPNHQIPWMQVAVHEVVLDHHLQEHRLTDLCKLSPTVVIPVQDAVAAGTLARVRPRILLTVFRDRRQLIRCGWLRWFRESRSPVRLRIHLRLHQLLQDRLLHRIRVSDRARRVVRAMGHGWTLLLLVMIRALGAVLHGQELRQQCTFREFLHETVLMDEVRVWARKSDMCREDRLAIRCRRMPVSQTQRWGRGKGKGERGNTQKRENDE